jgi:hypothetical protein
MLNRRSAADSGCTSKQSLFTLHLGSKFFEGELPGRSLFSGRGRPWSNAPGFEELLLQKRRL